MKRVAFGAILFLVLASSGYSFGYMDQGIITADKVLVLETPDFYPAVDAHTHISGTPESFDQAIKAMDASGVAVSVNLSGGNGERLRAAIEYSSSKYPGRFLNFCGAGLGRDGFSAPDAGEKIAQAIQEAHDMGAVGFGEIVKWALFSRIKWDDPRLEPVWAKLEELRMPINWHVGDPSRYWRPETPFNMLESSGYQEGFPLKQELLFQQERVLEKHPNLIVIAAHSNYLTDQIPYLVYRFEKYPNYYADISAACEEFGRVPEEFYDIAVKYADRFLYGTDASYGRGRGEAAVPEEVTIANFKAFHVAHFLFLGTKQKMIPCPFNGNYGRILVGWENGHTRYANDGVALPAAVLKKIYYENSDRILGTKAASWKPAEGFTYEVKMPQPQRAEGESQPGAGGGRRQRGAGSTGAVLQPAAGAPQPAGAR